MPKESKVDDSGLIATAKAVGTAAGKIASLAGVTTEPAARTTRKGKLPKKKNRHRLPRRQKKALQRARAAQQAEPASRL